MGSIPLPALALQHESPPDLLRATAQMEQIRAARQQQQAGELELQQKRLQLADQQAMTQALHDWDGKNLDDLPGLVTKRGGSANAVLGLRTSIVDQKTKLATLDKDQLALEGQKHDLVAGALSPLTDAKQIPDEQLPGAIHSTVQDLVQRRLIDPQHAQTAAALAQMPPTEARQQIELFRKGMMGQKAQIEEAKSASETQKNTAAAQSDRFKFQDGSWYDLTSGQPKQVNGSAADPQQFHDLVDQIAPPNANRGLNLTTKAQVDFALKQGRVKDAREAIDKAAQEVGAIRKETDPAVMKAKAQQAYADANARQQAAQGDPNVAGQMLAKGDLTLADLKSRGTTPQYITKAVSAAQKINSNYNPADEVIAESVAKSPSANQFFGSANSLIAKGGTLDQLKEIGGKIPQHDFPALNTVDDWQQLARGKGPLAGYAALALGVADDYGKVMGGGQASDHARDAALQLFAKAQSPEQRQQAIDATRNAVQSQRDHRIGKNQFMKRAYQVDTGNDTADPFAQFGGKAR